VTIESIAKSCFINDDNVNSRILNLDKSYHSMFLKNKKSFGSKKVNLLDAAAYTSRVGLGFFKYFNRPL
jgi:hypothetical protein